MIRLVNLKRQHITIIEEIKCIETEIAKDISLINLQDIALHINALAGKIKIHMMEEDNYMYPDLLKNGDTHIVEMTREYIGEMGDLAEKYIHYKNKYNIASKIKGDLTTFQSETKEMMDILKKRINKENHELYQIIEEKKL